MNSDKACRLKDLFDKSPTEEQLGVSKGYVSQIMKGEFNYTLKKLIELSLAVGKAPEIGFKPLAEIISAENVEVFSPESPTLNRVAEPVANYKGTGK